MSLDTHSVQWLNDSKELSSEDKPMFKKILEENGIVKISDIKLLKREDLIDMKVSIAPRNRFLEAIRLLNSLDVSFVASMTATATAADVPKTVVINARCDKSHAMTWFPDNQVPAHYPLNSQVGCDACAKQFTKQPFQFYHCMTCKSYDLCVGCAKKCDGKSLPSATLKEQALVALKSMYPYIGGSGVKDHETAEAILRGKIQDADTSLLIMYRQLDGFKLGCEAYGVEWPK